MNTALSILQSVFGYSTFRAQQESIIDCVTQGGDALVLMPTGGGKSLCYQIPALLRNGVGVVISPLIALMQNQVDALTDLGISAAYINSSMTYADMLDVEQRLRNREIQLLYIAPERLVQARTLSLLDEMPVALFAIDEAHCVSQWGHDFRADYLSLSLLAERFPAVPRIALTATADQDTRKEIIERLSLHEAQEYISGFDRPNLRYRITAKNNARQQLSLFLQQHQNESGIVYCLSRQKTEDTATYLCEKGYKALPYHAGLASHTRADHQSRFLREEGIIITATIAFGMGIDKPDVRFVVHLDMPKTVEAYYQETGRAGRDGKDAECLTLYGLQDVVKLRQMMEQSEGSEAFKRAEQQRLNALLGLCEITSCRRQALLNYFGDHLKTPCNNCDTCLEPPETFDGTVAAQKAMSAIYRSGQRFGVNHLIDILTGKKTEKVQQFYHHELPTFGVGKEFNKNQWRSVYRQLIARAYLNVNSEDFGAIQLNESAKAVLRSEEKVALRVDTSKPEKAARTTKTPLPDDIDIALYEALRDCRRQFADTKNVPPYVIFSNNTLQEMCLKRPTTLPELNAINGVGERKLKAYGDAFITTIAQHERDTSQ